MSDASSIEKPILDFIRSECLRGRTVPELTRDTRLLENGLIDSVTVFTLIGFIEQRFEIKFLPVDVAMDHFESVGALSALVVRKRGDSPS